MRPVLLAALAPFLLALACGQGPAHVAGEPACTELRWDGRERPASVLLLLGDTWQRDPIGAYGGPADTPHFDAFAARALRFDRAFTQAPWTKPSMATLFTSWYPSQHQVLAPALPEPLAAALRQGAAEEAGPWSEGLPAEFVTLAEMLREAGWRTAGFVSNPWLTKGLGFDQGFDVYDDSLAAWNMPGLRVSEAGLRWLRDAPLDQRFFLYLHYMDPHRPYPSLTLADLAAHADALESDDRPISRETRRAIRRLVRTEGDRPVTHYGLQPSLALLELAYRKGVEELDRALGVFLEGFADHPAARDAVVIITSDHGEALFTRGYGNHGRGLHDDELAIPLAMRLPGVEAPGGVVSCAVGLVDLMPTLCDYLGVTCPEPLFGSSLLGVGAREAGRFLVSEGVGERPEHRTIRNREWKLLYTPGAAPDGTPRAQPWSLYRVSRDREERDDLIAADATPRGEVRGAFETLSRILPQAVPEVDPPGRRVVPLSPEIEERLRALGYLGGDDAP